jgi:hypothetical protein
MCLQDLRIQAGTKAVKLSGVYDANGRFEIPDLRRAILVYGVDAAQTFTLAWDDGQGNISQLPASNGYKLSVAACLVYDRLGFAWVPPGKVFALGVAGSIVIVYVIEYDAAVDRAVADSVLTRGL